MDTNKTPPEGLAGMKKPRLTAMERLAIETGLDAGKTPYAIAQEIGRPPKTVMREIRGRAVESDKGAVGRVNNRCAHRYECTMRDVCKACYQRRSMQCKFCRQCNSHCQAFVEQRCGRLERPPFVCNGCRDERKCVLRKRYYLHAKAQESYETVLSESRTALRVAPADVRQPRERLPCGLLAHASRLCEFAQAWQMLAGLVNATHDGLLQLPEKLLAKRHVGVTIHCKWEFHCFVKLSFFRRFGISALALFSRTIS